MLLLCHAVSNSSKLLAISGFHCLLFPPISMFTLTENPFRKVLTSKLQRLVDTQARVSHSQPSQGTLQSSDTVFHTCVFEPKSVTPSEKLTGSGISKTCTRLSTSLRNAQVPGLSIRACRKRMKTNHPCRIFKDKRCSHVCMKTKPSQVTKAMSGGTSKTYTLKQSTALLNRLFCSKELAQASQLCKTQRISSGVSGCSTEEHEHLPAMQDYIQIKNYGWLSVLTQH